MRYFSGLTFSLGGSMPKYLIQNAHVPTFYGIQYNHAGSVRLRINKKDEYRANGPCAFVTHPGAYFEYGTGDGRPRHHNYVCFFGPRVQRYIDDGLIRLAAPSPLVRIVNPTKFLASMHGLIAAINGNANRSIQHSRMVHTLEDLLLMMHEVGPVLQTKSSLRTDELLSLIGSIEREPQKRWHFPAEAKRLSMTEQHFRRLFRTITGMSPQQYLIHLRLRSAAYRLVESGDSVTNIAAQAGIGNEYYFSRLFKKKYTVSPSEYRRESGAF